MFFGGFIGFYWFRLQKMAKIKWVTKWLIFMTKWLLQITKWLGTWWRNDYYQVTWWRNDQESTGVIKRAHPLNQYKKWCIQSYGLKSKKWCFRSIFSPLNWYLVYKNTKIIQPIGQSWCHIEGSSLTSSKNAMLFPLQWDKPKLLF